MIHTTVNSQLGAYLHRELCSTVGAERVRSALDPEEGQPGDLFVGVSDGGALQHIAQWERKAIERGLRFMPVHIQGGEAIIGPEIRPDRAGCLACWSTRYFGARRHARYFAQQADPSSIVPTEDPWLTPLTASIVSALAARQIEQCAADLQSTHRVEKNWIAYYFNLRTMTGRGWCVVPDSACPTCGRLATDTPEGALLSIERREKESETVDRLRKLSDLTSLAASFAGYRSNIVSKEHVNWNFDIGAVVSVSVTLSETRRPEPCSGFCATYEDAHTVAILEGLERYSGVRPRGIRSCVTGSVGSLGEQVVHPRAFGLHEPHEYTEFAGLLTPFSDELEMDFVWAYSFGQRRSVLLPRQLAYYSHGEPSHSAFVIEGSVGCALGSTHEECILHGLLEVIERDAFLLTWYAWLERPSLDILECADPEVRYRCRALREDGFDVFGMDITSDYGIPVVCVLARRREPQMPFAFCVSAAHLRAEPAIKKALRELTAVVCRYRIELQDEKTRRWMATIAEDPDRVGKMEDHALFYCHPASGRHLEFLVNSPERTSVEAIDEGAKALRSRDLGQELMRCIRRVTEAGSDVIVVKQTPPELEANGLAACKTLIAGAIPMTWGRHRRLDGLGRLDRALSNRRHHPDATGAYPNPAPHPFP